MEWIVKVTVPLLQAVRLSEFLNPASSKVVLTNYW